MRARKREKGKGKKDIYPQELYSKGQEQSICRHKTERSIDQRVESKVVKES